MNSKKGLIRGSIRSKSRQGETQRTKPHPTRRPQRHTSANNNAEANNSSNDQKRASGSGNNTRSSRRQPCRRVYLGPPRCSRVNLHSILLPMFNYISYGRSTDPNFEDPLKIGSQLPNPYSELAREVNLGIKRREESASQAGPQIGNKMVAPEGDGALGPLCVDIQINKETAKGNVAASPSHEKIFRYQEEQEDEDDDEEEGMPQAVRLSEPQDLAKTQNDIMKDIYKAKMEEISKNVHPRKLVKHLQKSGYFKDNYHGHARTTIENFSFKQGAKKPRERILNLLSSR